MCTSKEPEVGDGQLFTKESRASVDTTRELPGGAEVKMGQNYGVAKALVYRWEIMQMSLQFSSVYVIL